MAAQRHWHTGKVLARLTTLRALGLLLVALVLIAVMAVLGWWQLGVYVDQQRADAVAVTRREPIALDRALGPDDAFPPDSVGVPVTVEGRYDPAGQLYVRGLEGTDDTYAVVTPLVTATGSAILVVRGSSRMPQGPAPAGLVRVRGILEPSAGDGSALDRRRTTDGLNIAALVGGVDEDLYAGYVVSTWSDPPDHLSLVDPPLPNPSRWAGMRNLIYALQWWVFAGFVAFMWWRIVADTGDESPRNAAAGAGDGDRADLADAGDAADAADAGTVR